MILTEYNLNNNKTFPIYEVRQGEIVFTPIHQTSEHLNQCGVFFPQSTTSVSNLYPNKKYLAIKHQEGICLTQS